MKTIITKIFLILGVIILILTSVGCGNQENVIKDGEYSAKEVITGPVTQSYWIVEADVKIKNNRITVNDRNLGKLSLVEDNIKELFDTDLHSMNVSEEEAQSLINDLSSLNNCYCAEETYFPFAQKVYVFIVDDRVYLGLIENNLIKAVFACQ